MHRIFSQVEVFWRSCSLSETSSKEEAFPEVELICKPKQFRLTAWPRSFSALVRMFHEHRCGNKE